MLKEPFNQSKDDLIAAKKNKVDPYLALLNYRNIPRDEILGSPTKRFMGRRTKTQLPMSETLLVPQIIDNKKVMKRLEHYRQLNKKYYGRTTKLLPQLSKGDIVRSTDKKGKFIDKGKVVGKTAYPRSYKVNIKGVHY